MNREDADQPSCCPSTPTNRIGLMIACAVTSKSKGYPFEVQIPRGCKVRGVIPADHVKNLHWRRRNVRYIETLPAEVLEEVQQKLGVLIF